MAKTLKQIFEEVDSDICLVKKVRKTDSIGLNLSQGTEITIGRSPLGTFHAYNIYLGLETGVCEIKDTFSWSLIAYQDKEDTP